MMTGHTERKWIPLAGGMLLAIAFLQGGWYLLITRGFLLPPLPVGWPPHGHWMIGGFLSFLIMSERVMVFPRRWGPAIPLGYAVTGVFLFIGHPLVRIIHGLALLGWWVHRISFAREYARYRQALVEGLVFTGISVTLAVPGGLRGDLRNASASLGQIVLLILLERLEWMLPAKRRAATMTFLMFVLASMGLTLNVLLPVSAIIPAGILGLILIRAFRYDMTMQSGFRRSPANPASVSSFSVTAIRTAYGWGGLACLSMVATEMFPSWMSKDFVIHSWGLGFIFTMILAHAPLMLPVMRGQSVRLRPSVWLFWMFQLATLIRLGGDEMARASLGFWRWSGMWTMVFHIMVFFLYIGDLIRQLKHHPLEA